MKPAINITGTTHGVNLAPPVNHISTRFIAIFIDNMDIKDMPRAVLKAVLISTKSRSNINLTGQNYSLQYYGGYQTVNDS